LELSAVRDEVAARQMYLLRHFASHVGHETAEVAATDVALHDRVALAVFVIDGLRSFDDVHTRHLCQRDPPAARRRNEKLPNGLRGSAILLGQANDDGKAPSPIDDFGRRLSADSRLYRLSNVGDVQSISRQRTAIEIELDLHCARTHSYGHVRRARDLLDD